MSNENKPNEVCSFKKWQDENSSELESDFNEDKYRIAQMDEPPSFDEYCMSKWQSR